MLDNNDTETVDVLIRELSSNTSTIETNALKLQSNSKDELAIEELKITLHGIKGLFGFLGTGYQKIRIITHKLEDAFLEANDKSTEIENLLEYVDSLKELINRIKASGEIDIPVTEIFISLNQHLTPDIILDQDYLIKVVFHKKSTMKSARMMSLVNKLKRSAIIKNSVPSMSDLLDIDDFEEGTITITSRESRQVISGIISQIPEVVTYSITETKALEQTEKKETLGTQLENKVEVEIDHLDKISTILEELVAVGNVIEKIDTSFLPSTDTEILNTFTNRILEIQDLIFQIKQISVGIILDPLPRLIYDLTKNIDKEVEVFISSGQVKIDRPLLELLFDPIVVIVQNAVAHGIESTKERAKLKKNKKGSISVTAFQEEGNIHIHIKDDGKGIDGKQLWKIAKKKGLIAKNTKYNEQQGIDFIFAPDISTTEQISTLSGRGVGLYSARKTIESMNGNLLVETKLGVGTTFKIILPVTKPINSIIQFEAGDMEFGFPQESVVQIERINRKTILDLQNAGLLTLPNFIIEYEGKEEQVINLYTRFSSNTQEAITDQTFGYIHWVHLGKVYRFLINNIERIIDLAVDYDDPFAKNIPYIAGSSLIEGRNILFILNPRNFVERKEEVI